jgi:hypothetical protein
MPAKKKAPKNAKKKLTILKKTVGKKAVKKAASKKIAAKAKPAPKVKASTRKKPTRVEKKDLERAATADAVKFPREGARARSGGQSGDLQGLSDSATADSESVDELLEEGNSLEAEIVQGVEDVPDADEGEVRTHEVLEDDVPEEYLDQ